MSKVLSLIIGVIIASAVQECCCRYPDELIHNVLSRNNTTPTDLVHVIREWILLPSEMNMNQLIQCRDSSTNIWGNQCEDRIRQLIDKCQFNETSSVEFAPSDDVFTLKLQEESHIASPMYRMFSHKWTPGKFVQIIVHIFSQNSVGRMYSVRRFAHVRGPWVQFHILNESVSILPMFNYNCGVPTGYSITLVKLSWYLEWYSVTNIVVV